MKIRSFTYETPMPASADQLYDWHRHEAAFERLVPPGSPVKLIHKDPGLDKGVKVILRVGSPPFRLRWVAEHIQCEPGRSFTDKQMKGPCSFWEHLHEMIPQTPHTSLLRDTVHYRIPFGININAKLKHLFQYRHTVTHNDLKMASEYPLPFSKIGLMGGGCEVKARLSSLLNVLGYQIVDVPPYDAVVVFGNQAISPDKTLVVIHVGENAIPNKEAFKRYVRLIPSNILWKTSGIINQLLRCPIWKREDALPDVNLHWIHLDDAIYGIFFALSQDSLYGEYLLSQEKPLSLRSLYRKIKQRSPLRLFLTSPSLELAQTQEYPPLFSVGAPSFYSSIDSIIQQLII